MARIHDVAKAAGVSISTVSYSLSGKRPVSEATTRRIAEAIDAVGYEPNAGARMLAGRRTRIFALTEPFRTDTHAPTHMAFVLETSIAARRADYDVLLLTDADASAGMQRVASSKLVDAILVLDVAPADVRVPLSRKVGVPSVFIGIPDDHEGLTCVDFDFDGAAALAVNALADKGHEVIGLLGHQAASYELSNFPPRARNGFTTAAQQRSLRYVVEPIEGSAIRALHTLLDAGVTGIVLQTTEDAHVQVLAELARLGLGVPEDISLVSVAATFDVSSFSTPLDAIPLLPRPSCERAVELALAMIEGVAQQPAVHLIAPEYTPRGSVSHPHLQTTPSL